MQRRKEENTRQLIELFLVSLPRRGNIESTEMSNLLALNVHDGRGERKRERERGEVERERETRSRVSEHERDVVMPNEVVGTSTL